MYTHRWTIEYVYSQEFDKSNICFSLLVGILDKVAVWSA